MDANFRQHAIAMLDHDVTLADAIERLGFVQADPIRAPATAQDLILRHRVADYTTCQLEIEYPLLNVEEDHFFAYGFVSRSLWQLMHPRNTKDLVDLECEVLDAVRQAGIVHPRHLAKALGKGRARNDWGGYSQATKIALEQLHRRGLLRVAGRQSGVRLYSAIPPTSAAWDPVDRSNRIALAVVRLFEPVHSKTLGEVLARVRHSAPGLRPTRSLIAELTKSGQLRHDILDGHTYLSTVENPWQTVDESKVRFLAPFDPIVWDRRRFEHLWGWAYRFEAYVPPSKRIRGYYALPLLWLEKVIGWANISINNGELDCQLGFVDARPTDTLFEIEIDNEIGRFQQFLNL